MSSQTELEQRLAIVVGVGVGVSLPSGDSLPLGTASAPAELALSQLQQQIFITAPSNWIAQIAGTFKDEPAFDEILAYGREFRQTEPPSTEDLQSS
jgi:hypothetical protein